MTAACEPSADDAAGQRSPVSTTVQLRRLLGICDPRANWPWDCEAPEPSDLQRMLSSSLEVAIPVGPHGTPSDHIGRILYLARHGWQDAVEIDVGIPCLGYPGPEWPLIDGNHRVWAAALRGDEVIEVAIAGQVDHAAELLGVTEEAICGSRTQA